MEKIYLKDLREHVDSKYVGFKPNGGSIKPVHIANGAVRIIYGQSANTKGIKRLSYVSDSKGKTPPNNTLEKVLEYLKAKNAIEYGDIHTDELISFRNLLQKLVAVDDAVYSGVDDGMVSYSAGSKYFITGYSLYEDGGEFMGGIIKEYCPELATHIYKLLKEANDPLSMLFTPVLVEEPEKLHAVLRHKEIETFKNQNTAMKNYIISIKESGECLLAHFKSLPNPLMQIRIFNLFCIFNLIRYLALLETFYCEESIRPIFLDFSSDSQSSIARASVMSFTQINRAISRFYSWAYAQELRKFTRAELLASDTPEFNHDKKEKNKTDKKELASMWELAKADAASIKSKDDVSLIFGTTIYDMLALEASSHPIKYLRAVGNLSGILYPPTNFHANKQRFVLSQDVLEMVIRCCVHPSEVIPSKKLRDRLWNRLGIIVGGSDFEIKKLQEVGSILQADEDSLNFNFKSFANTLESMNFAEIMADGILQIRLGGVVQ